MSNSSKQIKFGAIISYFAIAINIITGLIYTPWMVGTIGKSQYGLYTLATSLISLFLVDFGLSSATGRYLSKYNAEGDKEGAENFLGAVYKLYLLVDAVIVTILIAIFFFLDSIYANLTPAELEQFKVVYIVSALFSVINFPFITFNGILTAYEKFIPLKIADVLYRVFNVGFTCIALLMGYGLYALVTVHAAVGLLILLIKFIIIKRTIPIKVNFKFKDKSIYKDIFGFSIWVTVYALAQRLILNITPSILGMVASSAAIAVFGVVTTIEGYTYTIVSALNGMFMPKISRIVSSNGDDNLDPLFNKVGKYQFALNGLIVVGFFSVGKSFIELWMGSDFAEAYYGIMLILIPGMFSNSLQIANTTMTVLKKVHLQAFVSLIAGATNVCISFFLSRQFGVIGACISIFIAYIVELLLRLAIFSKVLPIDIKQFIKGCYIRMAIPVALSAGASVLLNKAIQDRGWLTLITKGGLIVIIYAILVWFLGLSKTEKKQVLHFFKK